MTTSPDPTNFARVRALFEEALDLPLTERADHARRGTEDPLVLTEVLELLEEYAREDGDLPVPDAVALVQWFPSDAGLPGPGARVDRFEIVGTLGEGGMGRVFEAREDSPSRRVALKMVRNGLGTAASQRRFEVEAEVLARLLHPGIAQVYASGLWSHPELPETPLRPWFAMEFVPGARDLITFVRTEEFDLPRRLALFLELCSAIEHAHQRGVIHRDIKAANVLVDPDGRVKVIDFGIARVEDNGAGTWQTREGEVLGTLATMSPEQALGHWDEVDIRTDVYSLGVLLYELVAERAPYDLSGHSLTSAIRVLCETPPPRPSLTDGSRGTDLDWIALRALEKERDRRYASVPALAEDVRRFLNHEPVNAGPPTLRYRASKFLRRHRLRVTAAALVLFSLLGGLILASVERGRALISAENSRREAAHADFISSFLLDTLASPDPWVSGPDVRVRERIDSALDSIRTDLVDQPELQASLLTALGRTYGGLSSHGQALAVLEEALELHTLHTGADDPKTLEVRADRIDALLGLARFQEAREAAEVLGEDAANVLGPDDALVFRTLEDIVTAHTGEGALDRALEDAQSIAERTRQAFGVGHEETIGALRLLAGVYAARGEVLQAEDLARACLSDLERTLAPDHPEVLQAKRALAEQLVSRRRYDEAQELLTQTLERSIERFGEAHASTIATLIDLAALHLHRRELTEASEFAERALTQARRRLDGEHPLLLSAAAMWADVLALTGDHEAAEELWIEVLTVQRRRLPPVHSLRAGAENSYATLLYEAGRWSEAEDAYRRALAAAPAESRHASLAARHGLGTTLLSQGRPAEAARELEACVAERRDLNGPRNDDTLDTMTILSRACNEIGDLERARELADQVLEGRLAVHGPDAQKTAEARNNLAVVLQSQGNYVAAEETMVEVLNVFRDRLGEGHPATVRAWNNLGLAIHSQGRLGDARDAYLDGLDRGLTELESDHPALTRINLNLAELELQAAAPAESLALFEEVLELERRRDSPASLNARYAMSGRGRALKALSRHEEALVQAEATLEVLREALGSHHWETLRSALEVVGQRRRGGHLEEAYALARRAAREAADVPERAAELLPSLELVAGELALERNDVDAAERHFDRARSASLVLDPAGSSLTQRAEEGLMGVRGDD